MYERHAVYKSSYRILISFMTQAESSCPCWTFFMSDNFSFIYVFVLYVGKYKVCTAVCRCMISQERRRQFLLSLTHPPPHILFISYRLFCLIKFPSILENSIQLFNFSFHTKSWTKQANMKWVLSNFLEKYDIYTDVV